MDGQKSLSTDLRNSPSLNSNKNYEEIQNNKLNIVNSQHLKSVVRLNEAKRHRESATSREVEIDNERVERRCSNCDTNFQDVANRNFAQIRPGREIFVGDSNNINGGVFILCEGCKNSSINWYVNDVMMKNKNGSSGGGDDAHTVAMETDRNGSGDGSAKGLMMSNDNVVDHLKGMSLSDRRASITPRITLTNADDDPSSQKPYHFGTATSEEEAMMTDDDQCSSPLSPRFLAVPKLEELGPERRPPQLVPTM